MQKYQLDKIDKKILHSLLKNSREKFSQIAKDCKTTQSNIKNKYIEMKKSGLIKNPTIIVDINKIEYQGHLSMYVKIKNEEIAEFMNYVKNTLHTTGYRVELNREYNCHVLFPIKHLNEIENKKDAIKNHPSVISVKSNIWTQILFKPENYSILNTSEG